MGIGETSPDKKLHLKGDGGHSAAIKIESSNSNGPGFMYIQRNTDGKAYVLNYSDHALILGANNSYNQLYLENNGNVGIGTDSPGAKLNVLHSTGTTGSGKHIVARLDLECDSGTTVSNGYGASLRWGVPRSGGPPHESGTRVSFTTVCHFRQNLVLSLFNDIGHESLILPICSR